MFRKFNILKLQDLYKFQAVVDTHLKIQKGAYKIEHGINTRNSNLSKPKRHNLTRSKQSVATNGPNLWNSLPIEIRSIKSLPSFKKKLKSHYLSQYDITED